MRLLSLFFAFYFACLSTMTCTDEAVVCKEPVQTTVAAATHSDCGTGEVGDWCSPFCQCQCCGVAIISLPAPPAALATAELVAWGALLCYDNLVESAPTRALGAVWQPPQA